MLFLENFKIEINNGFPAVVILDKDGQKLNRKMATIKVFNRLFNYLLDIELLILRIVGFIPLHFVRLISYTAAGVKIGQGTHIHMGAQFFYPVGVQIGKGCIIGQNVFLDGRDKLKIGDYVDIASDVMVYNSEHDINDENFKAISAPVEIGDFCFIGPRAIILPGVKIGKGAVIAAGAVVTKDVADFAVVGGVPAQVISERKLKDLHYKLGRARLFQ
ncbi:MAG: acyltransferase [Candidatus Daviesbacteria bacterium]|nr:acyltransferase [Candidatus Daviesbacteria bacterium]